MTINRTTIFSSLLFLFLSSIVFAQGKKDIKDLRLILPETIEAHQTGSLDIGFEIDFHNGKKKRTKGIALGKYNWKKLVVEVEKGSFYKGRVHFDRLHYFRNKKPISISVYPKNQPEQRQQFDISIPAITHLSFSFDRNSVNLDSSFTIFTHAHFEDSTSQMLPEAIALGLVRFYPDAGKTINSTVFLNLEYVRDSVFLEVASPYYEVENNLLKIPVTYFVNREWDASGKNGLDGYHGQYGEDYICNGDGCHGTDGENGENGENGYPITIRLELLEEASTPLFNTSISSVFGTDQFVFDPMHSKLYITSNGGHGGDGGIGGDGGHGINNNGKDEVGRGGNGGHGGSGGDGGSGGQIIFEVDKNAAALFKEHYQTCFIITNNAGKGGRGARGGSKGRSGTPNDSILSDLFSAQGKKGDRGTHGQNGNPGQSVKITYFSPGG